MQCRGIRGAITVSANTKKSILAATKRLLLKMAEANMIEADDIGAILFTTTPDLNAEFPAAAAPSSVLAALRCLIVVDVLHEYAWGGFAPPPDLASACDPRSCASAPRRLNIERVEANGLRTVALEMDAETPGTVCRHGICFVRPGYRFMKSGVSDRCRALSGVPSDRLKR